MGTPDARGGEEPAIPRRCRYLWLMTRWKASTAERRSGKVDDQGRLKTQDKFDVLFVTFDERGRLCFDAGDRLVHHHFKAG